jgi:hypothetical protein
MDRDGGSRGWGSALPFASRVDGVHASDPLEGLDLRGAHPVPYEERPPVGAIRARSAWTEALRAPDATELCQESGSPVS